MSEFWVEKCENPNCGRERHIQSLVPTCDLEGQDWIYIRLGPSPPIRSFCARCARGIRMELEKILPELAIPLPDSDADRGPVQ